MVKVTLAFRDIRCAEPFKFKMDGVVNILRQICRLYRF